MVARVFIIIRSTETTFRIRVTFSHSVAGFPTTSVSVRQVGALAVMFTVSKIETVRAPNHLNSYVYLAGGPSSFDFRAVCQLISGVNRKHHYRSDATAIPIL